MKRTERHHLKENELAVSLRHAQATAQRYRRQITWGTIAVLVVVASGVGYAVWRGRVHAQAREELAAAIAITQAPVNLPPAAGSPPPQPGGYASEQARLEAALPKFMAVAERFPSTAAGIAARYHAGSIQAALGRPAEALARYREVQQRDPRGLYGRMAHLGEADAHMQARQYDEAITIYKALVDSNASNDGNLPLDGLLVQLGRAYVGAGKATEARQTFTHVLDQFPDSPFLTEARRELDRLDERATGD
jgi:tetratricopeptide (TPR) repeat protein